MQQRVATYYIMHVLFENVTESRSLQHNLGIDSTQQYCPGSHYCFFVIVWILSFLKYKQIKCSGNYCYSDDRPLIHTYTHTHTHIPLTHTRKHTQTTNTPLLTKKHTNVLFEHCFPNKVAGKQRKCKLRNAHTILNPRTCPTKICLAYVCGNMVWHLFVSSQASSTPL